MLAREDYSLNQESEWSCICVLGVSTLSLILRCLRARVAQ
jgi:hypothetical protein